MERLNESLVKRGVQPLFDTQTGQLAVQPDAPSISVIVANYNGARFLPALLNSLTRQSLTAIEILIIDDASTDESIQLVKDAAGKDPRIVLECLSRNSGLAAARNRGLARASGEWVAIVECDHLVHPFRFERLLDMAGRRRADIVADNLFVFYADRTPPSLFLSGRRARTQTEVSLADYIHENRPFSRFPALGHLKPLIRRSEIDRLGLRYNEQLRIGENYDFVLRALSAGLRFWVDPFPSYCYREQTCSISRRLRNGEIEAMEAAEHAFLAAHANADRKVRRGIHRRLACLGEAKAWNSLVDAIKRRQIREALRISLKHPKVLLLMASPLRARTQSIYRRLMGGWAAKPPEKQAVCLISRQRLFAATSGSAQYVLSLAEALTGRGLEVHLIHPSPSVFGRLPVMIRKRDAEVFSSIRVRGGVFIGPVLIALNPAILLNFAEAVAKRLLAKAGLFLKDRPAPYAVALPWRAADLLFAVRHAPASSKAILFDYGFQTVAAPYLSHKAERSFVIMHDLISSRQEQFERIGYADTLPTISETREMQFLTGADVIVAIQQEEADFVKTRAPLKTVICSPIAVRPAPHPQPGSDRLVLFAGTNTAPNVAGLTWFLSEVWPLVIMQRPQTEFWIAGSVGRALRKLPAGVKALGVVPSLSPLYREAGVVVSPLLTGSGLKIKLVEGLAQGKAIVATSPTLQGVERLVADAVELADAPEAFAARTCALLDDRALRMRRAASALRVAQKHFSAEACQREFLDLVTS